MDSENLKILKSILKTFKASESVISEVLLGDYLGYRILEAFKKLNLTKN